MSVRRTKTEKTSGRAGRRVIDAVQHHRTVERGVERGVPLVVDGNGAGDDVVVRLAEAHPGAHGLEVEIERADLRLAAVATGEHHEAITLGCDVERVGRARQ